MCRRCCYVVLPHKRKSNSSEDDWIWGSKWQNLLGGEKITFPLKFLIQTIKIPPSCCHRLSRVFKIAYNKFCFSFINLLIYKAFFQKNPPVQYASCSSFKALIRTHKDSSIAINNTYGILKRGLTLAFTISIKQLCLIKEAVSFLTGPQALRVLCVCLYLSLPNCPTRIWKPSEPSWLNFFPLSVYSQRLTLA